MIACLILITVFLAIIAISLIAGAAGIYEIATLLKESNKPHNWDDALKGIEK